MSDPNVAKQKRYAPEPDHALYLAQWAALYDGKNYDAGLAGYFLRKSHEWAEAAWGPEQHFSRVLEVGAGTGAHIGHVRHGFDTYYLTDMHPAMLEQAAVRAGSKGNVLVQTQDATKLTFDDDTFDRLIAAHVLEHLLRPHEVLREWVRVLKPGGVLTLVLPCDPGLLWRMGRYAVARRNFVKAGLEYDYWMAREHVNPINNLVAFVHHYFSDIDERWLPARIPSMDLNLFYIAHLRI